MTGRGRPLGLAGAMVLALAGALGESADAQVTLRGQSAPMAEAVRGVDAQGVTIAVGGGESDVRTIAWDRVARVNDPRGAAFAELSDTLWRARTRLTRGDVISAEPLLEQQFQTYATLRGATSGMIAEGLVRARLARGATVAAVPAWLVFLACGGEPCISRDERRAPGGFLETPGFPIDKETGLIPGLPPIWARGPASAAFARAPVQGFAEYGEAGSELEQRSATLAALYQAGAAFENDIGATVPVVPASLRADKAVRLITLIVSARISDEPARSLVRRELERELVLAGEKQWLEAWLRVGIARSLARDQTREARLLAVGQLAHLPARLADAVPALTAIALADMAIEMDQLGDTVAARALRDELIEFAPDHPALESEPMRRWPRSKAEGG